MKKVVLLFALLFVMQTVCAQSEIPGGFFGSAFGATLNTVRYNLEKEGFKYEEELTEGAIAAIDVPYESVDFDSVVFLCYNNKLYLVNFFLNLEDKDEALSIYKELLKRLNKKYDHLKKNEEGSAVTFHHLNRSVQLQWYVQPFIDGDPRYYISLAYYDEALLPPA